MKKMSKRVVSIIVAMTVMLPSMSVLAEEIQQNGAVKQAVSGVLENIEELRRSSQFPEEAVPSPQAIPDKAEDTQIDDVQDEDDQEEDPDVDLAAASDTSESEVLKALLVEQLGDEALNPLLKKGSGENITSNTNRLNMRQTDLSLPGKNGLDVNITRTYDNQNNNKGIMGVTNYTGDIVLAFYVYSFYNTKTGKEVNIGFRTQDEYYLYMAEPRYLTSWNDNYQGSGKSFVGFDAIANLISDTPTAIQLQPTDTKQGERETVRESAGGYMVTDKTRVVMTNDLGYGWYLEFPRTTLKRIGSTFYPDPTPVPSASPSPEASSEEEISLLSTGHEVELEGSFRDIHGNIRTFYGYKYREMTPSGIYEVNTYITPDDYDNIIYEQFEEDQQKDGITYNFTAKDRDGLTYYMYGGSWWGGLGMDARVIMVEDDYGNKIRYEYSGDTVTKITDTYGREINVSADGISYFDPDTNAVKSITYSKSELSASELDNGSKLGHKTVKRFSVTNEKGETTHYDSRETSNINIAEKLSASGLERPRTDSGNDCYVATGYNIERIIYPTGAETRYAYDDIYMSSLDSKIIRGLWAVTERKDVINGQETNKINYSLKRNDIFGSMTVTSTRAADGTRTEKEYDRYQREIEDNLYKDGSSYRSKFTEYEYTGGKTWDTIGYDIKNITTKENEVTSSVDYSYTYGHMPASESVGNKKVLTSYHTVDGHTLDIPQTVSYRCKDGTVYEEDYRVETTLVPGHNKVEEETVIQGDTVKSKKKYFYDANGEIYLVKVWSEDTNGDGVFDDRDKFNTINTMKAPKVTTKLLVANYVMDVTDSDGNAADDFYEEYTLNIYGNPTEAMDSNGNTINITYDELNRPIKYDLPNGGTQTVEYNIEDMYTIVTNEKGDKVKYSYDDLGRAVSKERWYNGMWKAVSSQSYDSAGRVKEAINYTSDGVGTKTAYTYDELDKVTKAIVTSLAGGTLYTEDYTYNGDNNNVLNTQKTVTAADGSKTAVTKQYTNDIGELVKEEVSDGTNTYTKTYTYDYMSRPLTETDSRGNTTSYEYDYAGNVTKTTDAWNYSTTSAYDLAGRKISDTDQLGNTATYTYDELDRVIKQVTPFDDSNNSMVKTYYDGNSNVVKQMVQNNAPGEAESFKTIEYKYDSMNNVTAAIGENGDVDSVVQYEYNSNNLLTKMITGLTEYTANPTGGAHTLYSYNSLGQLEKTTDPLGMETSYSYDYLDNQTGATDRNGSSTTISYSPFGVSSMLILNGDKQEKTAYNYNSIGQVTSKSLYENGVLRDSASYTYDAFGRTTSEVENGFIKEYGYDENSNVTSFKLKQGNAVKDSISYNYDELNRVKGLITGGDIFSYGYDERGNLAIMGSGKINKYYTYNKAGLPISVKNSVSSTKKKEYNYTYYLDGNRKTDSEINGVNKSYQYDGLGHLVNETQTNGEQSDSYNYVYDAYGNRTKLTVNGGENYTTDYGYDLNNRLLSQKKTTADAEETTSYRYDNNGNQLFYQKVTYTQSGGYDIDFSKNSDDFGSYKYNLSGQVTDINNSKGIVHYDYNVNGLRKSKTVDGVLTNFTWNGNNMIAESNVNGGIRSVYTYDMTGILMEANGNARSYYMKNAHGDVMGIVDQNRNITKSYQYDAFGNEIGLVEADTNPFRYCGEYYDDETGDIYLRARYYNSGTGRFVSEDPIKDGLNWYSYCDGNPVMFIDSLGLAPRKLRDLVNETTGSISWNGWVNTATVEIDGTKRYYVVNGDDVFLEGKLVGYMDNGSIIIDDSDFNRDFDIVGTITISSYHSNDENISSAPIQYGKTLTGHSFVHYQADDGRFDTYYSTWAWGSYGEGIYIDRAADLDLAGRWETESYSKRITRNQESRMINEIESPENNSWSYYNNCSGFATKVFNATVGDTYFNTWTPIALREEIKQRKEWGM